MITGHPAINGETVCKSEMIHVHSHCLIIIILIIINNIVNVQYKFQEFCKGLFHKIIIYTVSGKKRVWSISGITSANSDRFLKFFHYYNLQKICNKGIVKYPTTP